MAHYPFDSSGISHRNDIKPAQKQVGGMDIATPSKKCEFGGLKKSILKGPDWIEATIPIFTVSEANGGIKKAYKRNGKTRYRGEHWTEKHKRHKLQKGSVALMLRPHRRHVSMPCEIYLTRYAPDLLDRFDNLPMSLKWILDAVCEIITGDYQPGRADSYEGIKNVHYSQIISKDYAVKIKIQNLSV